MSKGHSEITVAPADWVRGDLIYPMFGITTHAAKAYRRNGLWTEGIHWKKDPANRIVFSTKRINQWLAS